MVNGIHMSLIVKKGTACVLSQNRFNSTPASMVSNYATKQTSTQPISKDQAQKAKAPATGTLKDSLNERLKLHRYIDDLRSKFARDNCKNK